MYRLAVLLIGLLAVAGCTNPNDLDEAPAYLGNFALGHNVVVAPNLTKGPVSRDASKEEWIDEMKAAIDERFGRYDGSKLYHLGISVEGYVLAIPGVPIVASPKSALVLNVTAWDDAAGGKLNEKPHQVIVAETISGNTIFGSGLTQSKQKQMHNLTRNAAKQIQNWLVKMNNDEGWFEDDGLPAKRKPRQGAPEPDQSLVADEADAEAPEAAEETSVIVEDPAVAPDMQTDDAEG